MSHEADSMERIILIVEDEVDVASTFGLLIEGIDPSCHVRYAYSLDEALGVVDQIYGSGKYIDLALCDGSTDGFNPQKSALTDLQGPIVTRRIRELALLNQSNQGWKPPVITVVSGNYFIPTPEGDTYLQDNGAIASHGKDLDYDGLEALITKADLLRPLFLSESMPDDAVKLFQAHKWRIFNPAFPQGTVTPRGVVGQKGLTVPQESVAG